MSKENKKTKFVTKDILKSSLIGAFQKLSPRYMIKNPVMFVVEIGFFIALVLTIFPTVFGDDSTLRVYNGLVAVILFITVLFANFAESVAEGRGKAQAESLKKTKKDTMAHLLLDNGEEKLVNASELKKGGVKDKFIDNVYSLLTDDKPAAEQLEAIREQYEEYFDSAPEAQPTAPQFGANVQGQMPSGNKATTFEAVWGIPKKG